MNTISPPKTGEPGNDRISEERNRETIPPNNHEINITEGGEFLDDAIRMKDQPLEEASEKPLQKISDKHLS